MRRLIEARDIAAIAAIAWFTHQRWISGEQATWAILAITGVVNLTSLGMLGGRARPTNTHIPTNQTEQDKH